VIVTVGNTKGGVGKTTLALNLAIARARQGRDVWLIDADRQGTAQTAVSLRSEAGRQPGIACAQYDHGPTLRAQVRQQRAKFDDIIIDAGGRDSTALRAALTLTDVLVVPFQPRSYDVWALGDISALVEEARFVRDGLIALAVLNLADAGTGSPDNREASAAVADFPSLTYVGTSICRRKAVANAAGQGLAVDEIVPRDIKASREMDTFVSRVFHVQNPSFSHEKAMRDGDYQAAEG
jgi:chromosome partitioning protein